MSKLGTRLGRMIALTALVGSGVAIAPTVTTSAAPAAQGAWDPGCYVDHEIKYGSNDKQILCVKKVLRHYGYLPPYKTTHFGYQTRYALRKWQKAHGLIVSGYVDEETAWSMGIEGCPQEPCNG